MNSTLDTIMRGSLDKSEMRLLENNYIDISSLDGIMCLRLVMPSNKNESIDIQIRTVIDGRPQELTSILRSKKIKQVIVDLDAFRTALTYLLCLLTDIDEKNMVGKFYEAQDE